MDRFQEAQANIDVMFELSDKPLPRASERILDYARRGVEAPEVLSHKEILQLCYAYLAHYAAMGIE